MKGGKMILESHALCIHINVGILLVINKGTRMEMKKVRSNLLRETRLHLFILLLPDKKIGDIVR